MSAEASSATETFNCHETSSKTSFTENPSQSQGGHNDEEGDDDEGDMKFAPGQREEYDRAGIRKQLQLAW